MNFMTRRSIRKYQNKPIEKEKIEEIIKCALVAPTGRNSHSTHFVVVDDKEKIEKLSQAREHGGSFAKEAPIVIAVMGDKEKSSTVEADCCIGAFAIQMEAHELGLGSCWIHIRNRLNAQEIPSEAVVREIVGAPDNYIVMCLIAIGYPEELKPTHNEKEIDFSRVSLNNFDCKK